MSVLKTVQSRFVRLDLLKQVCDLNKIPCELARAGERLKRRLYNSEVTGLAAFDLPGWRYPCVVTGTTGEVAYDNYEGAWGDRRELNRVGQAYALLETRAHLDELGYRLEGEPQVEADGSLVLTVVQ